MKKEPLTVGQLIDKIAQMEPDTVTERFNLIRQRLIEFKSKNPDKGAVLIQPNSRMMRWVQAAERESSCIHGERSQNVNKVKFPSFTLNLSINSTLHKDEKHPVSIR